MDEQYCLYNESCMDAMKKMEDDSVDLVLTDPPYNLGLFMKNRATNLKAMRDNFFGAAGWDDLEFDEWEKDMDEMFAELARVIKKRGSVIMFMSIINLHFINSTEAWIYFTYKSHTGTFNNNGKAIHDFVETSVTPGSEKAFGKHPTQKPIQLLEHFVTILTNENEVIFDPFFFC